jgi:lipopolysaccharide transport system permease protein
VADGISMIGNSGSAVPAVVITPERFAGFTPLELWKHRELLLFLVWRELALRYKQTLLGAGWAVVQPVLMAVVFSIVLGRWLSGPSAEVPYFVFALAGLVPWQLFMHGLTTASGSLVNNERLITRVYLPRVALPLATIIAGVVDLLIALVVLLVVMFALGLLPPIVFLLLPLVIAWLVLAAAGVGVFFAALNVRYRDVRYALPFLSQVWLFASPVLYSFEAVPAAWQGWLALNPMVGIVETFRWAVLGTPVLPATLFASTLGTAVAVVGGFAYFRWAEKEFADVI